MSRNGVILDMRNVPGAWHEVELQVEAWRVGAYAGYPWPRSKWLSDLETMLAQWFPFASSRDRNDTARSLAPFWLAEPPTAP